MKYKEKLNKSKETISKHMSGKSHTILVVKDENRKPGFRLTPWCKIYPKKGNTETHLNSIKFELMSHGINYDERDNTITVSNISNCQLLLKLLDEIPEWWRRSLKMISEGKHKEPRKLLKIVKTKNANSNYKGEPKWTVDEIREEMKK